VKIRLAAWKSLAFVQISDLLARSDLDDYGVGLRQYRSPRSANTAIAGSRMPIATMITLDSGIAVPLITPNDVMNGDDFYISHNSLDAAIYGGETTALVIGQMQAFYILNGDHQAAYAALMPQGLSACLAYFKAHQGQMNKFSDRIGDA